MAPTIITLDVREDFRLGRHPREKIMAAFNQIGAGESLRLLVPFEPVPLYEVATRQGLDYTTRKIAEDNWEVVFTRNSLSETKSSGSDDNSARTQTWGSDDSDLTEIVAVDARGLEPPQPMVTILEALAALPDGAALRARTDRRPMHLYAMLEARGFSGTSEEQPDGSFITQIRRS